MKVNPTTFFLAILLAGAGTTAAQSWDTSGNAKLTGTYYFREVSWLVGDSSGDLSQAIAVYGILTFNGNGTYTVTSATVFDSNSSGSACASPCPGYPTTGTYSIAASGFGFISTVLTTKDTVYGMVTTPASGGGIFIGSATENSIGYNDIFIAAPLASPVPTNSFFNGVYSMVSMDFPSINVAKAVSNTREASFQLNANGSGAIAGGTATGHIAGNGSTATSQNFAGLTYSFTNGAASINFGGTVSSTTLLYGAKNLYFSPDGNFVFGGSPTGFDMLVGVKTTSGSQPSFSGSYYQAGVVQDDSSLASAGTASVSSNYGSVIAISGSFGKDVFGHRRVLSLSNPNTFDYTYRDVYTANADGSYDDPYHHYVFTANGAMGVGLGTGTNNSLLGFNVVLQAPNFAAIGGPGVHINPDGIRNNGSFSPFTASVSPGELVAIYGSNLASTTQTLPNNIQLPFSLDGVQVMVNGRAAPVIFVSPGQIDAVVPFGTIEAIASFQVINNGVSSNVVSNFVGSTSPGIFQNTIAPGIAYGAVLHPDYSQVLPAAQTSPPGGPAHVGEYIQIWLTGLGAVNPSIADGTPGPVTPLSLTTNSLAAYVNGIPATIAYNGLAPDLNGFYQVNIQIPTGVATGDVFLDIAGPDSYSSVRLITIQ